MEAGREFTRPGLDLYATALSCVIYTIFLFRNILLEFRDIAKRADNYQQKEKEFYSDETTENFINQAKSKEANTPEKLEEFKKFVAERERLYREFMKGKMIEMPLRDFEQEDIDRLVAWYESRRDVCSKISIA